MKILIAEDEQITRRVLKAILVKWGYDVIVVRNGVEAWEILQSKDAPKLVILDWIMPVMDGIAICHKVRESPGTQQTYIILLTVKEKQRDIVEGLEAGADDYITKPFDPEELHARVQVGMRIIELQSSLADRVRELEDALLHIKRLRGLLPICSYCKKIRDDHNYWRRVEDYISEYSEARFSHSVCPDCYEKYVKSELARLNGSIESTTTREPRKHFRE